MRASLIGVIVLLLLAGGSTAPALAVAPGSIGGCFSIRAGGNIDPCGTGASFACSDNAGWINFAPTVDGLTSVAGGVTVTDTAITGFAWGENIGWINLNPAPCGGVVNDRHGNLSGFAWGE